MTDRAVVPRKPPNPIVKGRAPTVKAHPPIIYTKGSGRNRIPVFAKVDLATPKPPSVEARPPLPPHEDEQQPMTPSKNPHNASPRAVVANHNALRDTPPESPINPKVVGLMIEQRRRDYAEKLRARNKRIYLKPQHEITQLSHKPNQTKQRVAEAQNVSAQNTQHAGNKWGVRPEEKAAILSNNAMKRSKMAMQKLKEKRLNDIREQEKLVARRMRVNQMGRLIRQQNRIRMQEEKARLADEDNTDYDIKDTEPFGELQHSSALHVVRNVRTGEHVTIKSTVTNVDGMGNGGAVHRPPRTQSKKIEAASTPLQARPRKPRVPRLSGRRSSQKQATKNGNDDAATGAKQRKRKPPVPRLSGKSKGVTRNTILTKHSDNHVNNRHGVDKRGSPNKPDGDAQIFKNRGTDGLERNDTKENEKSRIQQFIKEKRKRRRQERKSETLKEAKEDLLRRKRLRQLDEKFRKRREMVKRRLAEEAREKSKRKKARRRMMKKLRKGKRQMKKVAIDDLPSRANLIGGDIYNTSDYMNDNAVDQFEWQTVETKSEEYFNEKDEIAYESQLSPSPVNILNEMSPSSSRPASSLAQPYTQSNTHEEDDADFLNREALLNGVGIASDNHTVSIPKVNSDASEDINPGDLNMNLDYRKMVEQSAIGEFESGSAEDQQQNDDKSTDPKEREIILNRMNALKRATEQLSARISILSSQQLSGNQVSENSAEANILKQMAVPADLKHEEEINAANMRAALDTAENARRVENETARHIHRMVKEVANSDLPTYDVDVKDDGTSIGVNDDLQAPSLPQKLANNMTEQDDNDGESDYEEEVFDSDSPGNSEESTDVTPGIDSLSNSVKLSNDNQLEQDRNGEPLEQDVSVAASVPHLVKNLEQQDSQFGNVMKDAHKLFQKHSQIVENSYKQEETHATSIAPMEENVGSTSPTIDLKLAAEAAAAVAAATRASREALERARQLEADSKIGVMSIQINPKSDAISTAAPNIVPIENDYRMSERAYDIVDSYSILDIYAEDAVQHEHYQQAIEIRNKKLQRQKENEKDEGESTKMSTVAIQTGTYWDTLLMKPTIEKEVNGATNETIEVDPQDEEHMRKVLPSPKLVKFDEQQQQGEFEDTTTHAVRGRAEPYSPPRTRAVETENVKRLSPGSLSRKLLAEVDLLQELTESEKQLDAIVHAKELEMAQKETITLANQWSAQQEEAARLAEMVAAEQAHAAEMQLQASQITLTLQSAHEEQLLSMNAHLEMIRKENEAAKIRETGAQTTEVVTLNQGTDPDKHIKNNQSIALSTGGLIFDGTATNKTIDDLIENTQEYSADFEAGEESALQNSQRVLRASARGLQDSEIPDEIEDNISMQNDTIQNNNIAEEIDESLTARQHQNQTQVESIVEEEFSMQEASVQSVAEEYAEDFESVKSEEVLLEGSIKEDLGVTSSSSYRSASMGSDLEKSTKRLIKKIQKDMEARQRHENELLDVREAAIKERTTEKMKLLQNQQHIKYKDLSVEELANERDRISFTFKKNIAEVQRQRAALQVRHYREILKLRSRQKVLDKLSSTENEDYSSDVESEMPTTDDDRSRRSKSPIVLNDEPETVIVEEVETAERSKGKSRSGSFVLEVHELDQVEDEAELAADEFELNVQEESVQEEMKFSDNESSHGLKRSLSRASETSAAYDDDFEDDFEDDGIVEDSIRMQAISQELRSLQQNAPPSNLEESSDLRKRELELEKRRDKADKLLKEKQKIVDRARRREALEEEEKKVNDLLERALNYDVEEEIRKLKQKTEEIQPIRRSQKLSPVQQQLLENQKSQQKQRNLQKDKVIETISLVMSEDEDVVDEIITVHETSTSRIEDSYGDDTFEDSNQSIAKVSSLTPGTVDNKQSSPKDSVDKEHSPGKTKPNIVDADKLSVSIESDIVIEEDENIKDDVDISESWKNSMTSFDQNDGYDSNASSSFMGSAVKASLSQSTNIESSPRPGMTSGTPNEEYEAQENLEAGDSPSNLDSFDMVDEARTPKKLPSTKKAPITNVQHSSEDSMIDSFDMIQDANSPQRIVSPKKSPKSNAKQRTKSPSSKDTRTPKSKKTRSPKSSRKKKKLSRSDKKRSPKNDNPETSKPEKTKPIAHSVIQKLGKEKAAEVLTDMILKDLAKDVSITMSNKKTSTSIVEQTGDSSNLSSDNNDEVYTDDGGSDFIEESLDVEDQGDIGLGNTLDGGGAIVLNSTSEDVVEDEVASVDHNDDVTNTGKGAVAPETDDMYEFEGDDLVDDQATYPYDSNNNDVQGENSDAEAALLQAQKMEEETRIATQEWKAKSKIYVEFLLKHVGLHQSSSNVEKRLKHLIENRKAKEDDEFYDKFDDDAIASNVYIDIERDSENEDHVGIYNKLIFDAVNEALEKFLDARDKSKDTPWIPRNNGLDLRSNFESLAFSLKKTIDDLIFRFDDLDANPRAARRFADLDGDTRIPLNTPLTAEERLETVLTAAAIEIDQSWNDDYKVVEAGVKLQIADMILEELLYDTTYHVHLVMGDD